MKAMGLLVVLLTVLMASPAMGQTQDSSSDAAPNKAAPAEKTPSTNASDKKPETKQKPKKVWTNDEVGSLKGSVSVVGGKTASRKPTDEFDGRGDEESSDPHAERVQQFRDALDQLRTQIGEADARINQLKSFKAENASPNGGIDPNHKYNMVPPEEQVKQLENRKKELQAKIEELENQARKEGIDPGELR